MSTVCIPFFSYFSEYLKQIELKETVKDITSLNKRLHFAILIGNQSEVIKVLSEGADVDALNDAEQTPLLVATNCGYLEIVKILLEKGADTERNSLGYTPLIVACSAGYIEIASLLIDHGANLEARDDDGNTPFLQAVLEGRDGTVKFLLIVGVNHQVKNYKNETAEQVALKNGHSNLAEVLKKLCEQ